MRNGKGWTLFLDRDGVINKELPDDYVKNWSEFEWEPKAKEAISILSNHFDKIFIITNQRGVGIGVMTENDLLSIHSKMVSEINEAGGRIEKIYYCTDADRNSPNRKPNCGMGLQAKADYPEINFNKTVMVGNTLHDMQFGRSLGTRTVFIDEKKKYNGNKTDEMDEIYKSLHEFSLKL